MFILVRLPREHMEVPCVIDILKKVSYLIDILNEYKSTHHH